MSNKNFVSYADEEVLMTEIGEKIKSGDTYKMFLGVYNPVTDEFVDPNTGTNIEKVLGAPYHDMITGQYFMGVPYSGGGISFYPVRNSIYSASSTSIGQMSEYYGNFAIVDVKWYNTDDNLTYEPVFTVVDSPSGNPKTQGWYEGTTTPFSQIYYTPTSDTSVQSGKTYYSFEWKEVIVDLETTETTIDYSDIISIADAFPKAAKDVKLKVEAVQDLHGYNNPWVGGAGKNKIPYDLEVIKSRNNGGTWNGNVYTYRGVTYTFNDNGVIKVNGTANTDDHATIMLVPDGTWLPQGDYVLSCEGSVSGDWMYIYDSTIRSDLANKNIPNFTYNGTDSIALRYWVGKGNTVDTTIKLMIRPSGTSADWEPYENICPISGWDNAKVTRSGKNLLPLTLASLKAATSGGSWADNVYTVSNIAYTVSTNAAGYVTKITANGSTSSTTDSYFRLLTNLDSYLTAGTDYILNGCPAGGGQYSYVIYSGSAGVWDDAGEGSTKTYVDTIKNLYIKVKAGTTITNLDFYPQIRLASVTDATYEPYQGEELTISLNGTRYGGTLDVTSGVLTLTHGEVDLGTLNWDSNGHSGDNYEYIVVISGKAYGVTNMICSDMPVKSTAELYAVRGRSASNEISVVTKITTKEAFKTSMDGVQLVYELATPQTIQLTAEEVQLLQGNNTLFGDTGDIQLTYNPATYGNIVEEVGELEDGVQTLTADISTKLNKTNPTGTGSFSLNRNSYGTIGSYSFVEGYQCIGSGNSSHAEGWSTTASAQGSHSEGAATTASGIDSHAEGTETEASANHAHAEGSSTKASGSASHAEGYDTVAGYNFQHVGGKFNDNKATTLFEIGNGTDDNARSNAFEVYSDGSLSTDNGVTKVKLENVGSEIQAFTKYTADTGVKNFLKNEITTTSTDGMTFTKNADGTITTGGSNTSQSTKNIFLTPTAGTTFKKGTYILNGCPSGANGFGLFLISTQGSIGGIYDRGNGIEFTLATDVTDLIVTINVDAGKSINGLTFKPMIREATITDPTYQPYAMTNRELTQDVTTIVSQIEVASGITLQDNKVIKCGDVVHVYFEITSPPDTTGGNVVIGTIPFLPRTNFSFINAYSRSNPFDIKHTVFIRGNNGEVVFPTGVTSSGVFVEGTFICK